MKPRILLFYFLPVLAWMALIFYLSGLPQQDLEGSKGILDLVPGREYTVHAALYAVLALLLSRTLLRLRDRPVLVLLAGGAAASLAYGITDEWHQTFVDGRSASLADLLADAIGAIAGAAAYGTARRIALPARAGASSHDR